jgi:multidrug efflux pump subunit AcrB
VTAQADSPFRLLADDIRMLKTRNADGGMVPLGSVATVRETSGAGQNRALQHVSQRRESAARPRPDSAAARRSRRWSASRRRSAPRASPPNGPSSRSSKSLAGNSALYIFRSACSSSSSCLRRNTKAGRLPLAIILIVPMCLLRAIGGVWLRNFDNNILTQIGFVVLVGLACKNAILIVEFAQQNSASRRQEPLRRRRRSLPPAPAPDPDDQFAFILGCSAGHQPRRGAEMRQALGTAVFYGMLGVTFFGLLLTPCFTSSSWRSRSARSGSRTRKRSTSAATDDAGRLNNPHEIAIASDHAGFAYKERLIAMLREADTKYATSARFRKTSGLSTLHRAGG